MLDGYPAKHAMLVVCNAFLPCSEVTSTSPAAECCHGQERAVDHWVDTVDCVD